MPLVRGLACLKPCLYGQILSVSAPSSEWMTLPVPGEGRPRRCWPYTERCTAAPQAGCCRSPASCSGPRCRQAGPRILLLLLLRGDIRPGSIQAGNILPEELSDCLNCRLEEPRSLKRKLRVRDLTRQRNKAGSYSGTEGGSGVAPAGTSCCSTARSPSGSLLSAVSCCYLQNTDSTYIT